MCTAQGPTLNHTCPNQPAGLARICHPACPGLPWAGANPDFLLSGPHQDPWMRVYAKESRMQLASATNIDKKSGVAPWRDLLFLSVHPI